MKCHQVQKQFLRYADGDLPSQQAEEVARHLGECPECRRLFHEVRETWKLARAEKIEYQPFLYTRIRQRMNSRETATTPALPRMVRLTLQPAIFFIVLGLGIFIGIQLGQGIDSRTEVAAQDQPTNYLEEYAENHYLNGLKLEPLEQEMFGKDSTSAPVSGSKIKNDE